MAVVGSAIIQLTADVARIKKDLSQVKFVMKKMERDVQKTGKKIRTKAERKRCMKRLLKGGKSGRKRKRKR